MKKIIIILLLNLFFWLKSNAQEGGRFLAIDELFRLAEQNSSRLSIARLEIESSKQGVRVAKIAKLPEINVTAEASYLSNITVLEPSFSYSETIKVPHFGNNLSVDVRQVLSSGASIKNQIRRAELEEKLSVANFEEERERVKMILLGRYLELCRLFNQRKIYNSNTTLARARLKNIKELHRNGMVTKNDIIRSDLQITDLEVISDEIESNIAIINRELCVALELPEQTVIKVDTAISASNLVEQTYSSYLNDTYNDLPLLKSNAIKEDIAEKNIRMAKSGLYPTLSLFASDGVSRPYLYTLPIPDIYTNFGQAGLRLQYNLSSIYKSKEHIRLAQIQRAKQSKELELAKQHAQLDVNAAFIKYNEAKRELNRREKSRLLADDNYRIVEQKYLNQLALLTDIIDASSAKLTSELNQSTAVINIIYQWYQLQKVSGKL